MEMQNRYSRHELLKEVGVEGNQKIRLSKVLVIGAGGLGRSEEHTSELQSQR